MRPRPSLPHPPTVRIPSASSSYSLSHFPRYYQPTPKVFKFFSLYVSSFQTRYTWKHFFLSFPRHNQFFFWFFPCVSSVQIHICSLSVSVPPVPLIRSNLISVCPLSVCDPSPLFRVSPSFPRISSIVCMSVSLRRSLRRGSVRPWVGKSKEESFPQNSMISCCRWRSSWPRRGKKKAKEEAGRPCDFVRWPSFVLKLGGSWHWDLAIRSAVSTEGERSLVSYLF